MTPPRNREELTLTLGEPAHGGACVARDDDGRVVFVRHGLPGEKVVARVSATRKRLAWANVIEVLEASPDRVEPAWPQAAREKIGGAELCHVRPAAQRTWKEDVLRGQIRRVGGEGLAQAVDSIGGVHVQACPGDEDPDDLLLHRRTRIELVADKDGRLGMSRYRSNQVVALESMPLAVDALCEIGLFDGNDSRWLTAWGPRDRVRAVASTGGDIAVVTPSGTYDGQGKPLDREKLRWVVEPNPEPFNVRPSGFWQTHVRGAQVLSDAVRRLAGQGSAAMELYSGAGLFTRSLAGAFGRVVSLEGDDGAVEDAALNLGGAAHVETFIGDVDHQGILDLSNELQSHADVVVMDPPRSGAGDEVCQTVAALGSERIVLVSCDPAAGARDLRTLTEGGYRLTSLDAWDLFPHTHHVEFIAALEKD